MRENQGSPLVLALGYGDADKLLNALPILLLSGAADGGIDLAGRRVPPTPAFPRSS